MYCGDSRHFAARCPRKLKTESGQVEINLFKKDLGKGKDHKEESGKVLASSIWMAIALGTNLVCLQLLNLVFEFCPVRLVVQQSKSL
jgi:hypothetical protein